MNNLSKIAGILSGKPIGQTVNIAGWVRTKRDSKGGFSFIEINDGSSIKNIQVIAESRLDNYNDEIMKLSTGSSVFVSGIVTESPASGQDVEIKADTVSVYSIAPADDYPLQKKRHSFEFLREIAHLRPRTNTFGAVARVRSKLSFAIHKFFNDRGFQYIHTPIITTSDCEGAGEMFRVTTLDMLNVPKLNGQVDYSADFFGKPANLTVSGQLEAEMYALALGNVYTFGPTFRAENSNTSRHLAEFWMVEPEMAFCDLEEDAKTAQEFIKYIIGYALDNCVDDIAFFNKYIDAEIITTLNNIINSDFEMITYTDAVNILSKANAGFEYKAEWGHNLQAEHERYLAEQYFKKPVTVTGFPKTIKPFYMRLNDDGKTVAAMDILFPKIGEIIGGSQREERLGELKSRMNSMGLDERDYWWYIESRVYGSAPHAGFGLGFDRLVQFVCGMGNIRDVIPFPRTPKNAGF